MYNLKELKTPSKAIDGCLAVYETTGSFLKHEMYNPAFQLRRSAVSVPPNISEGAGRNTNGEFAKFPDIATEPAYELQTQTIISEKLNLMSGKKRHSDT